MHRLEKDLYTIEEDDELGKCIHIWGYAYLSDDCSEKPYRMVEFTFLYIPVRSNIPFNEIYETKCCSCKQYISDYDEAGILKCLDEYFETRPVELDYCDITPDTPCGCYIVP